MFISAKENLGGRIQTCEHLLPRQARLVICGTPSYKRTSGRGVEPLFTDSKSAVLPLDDPEIKVRDEVS